MSISELLSGLASSDAESAWRRFLGDYSPLLLGIARKYENDEDRVMDCYVFVCEKLSDDGFGRLLKFKPEGPATFRTWLATVARNLCIDWRRQAYGRLRPIRAIARLSELEQLVFHHLYEAGMTRLDCLNVLSDRFPDLSEERIASINSRLHALLSSRQRWQVLARKRRTVSLDLGDEGGQAALEPANPGPQTDRLAERAQDLERLQAAMSRLASDERLVLNLRFRQELTFEEIARLMKLTNPDQAFRKVNAAVKKLAGIMES